MYSDNIESDNNPSVAVHNDEIEQGESDLSESVSLVPVRVYVFTDAQHSDIRTPPWAPVHSESVLPTEDEANADNAPSSPSAMQQTPEQRSLAAGSDVTTNPDLSSLPPGLEADAVNAPTSLSGISEQFPEDFDSVIESDSSSLAPSAMGHESPRCFKSSDSNICHKFHPKMNGDDLSLYYEYSPC